MDPANGKKSTLVVTPKKRSDSESVFTYFSAAILAILITGVFNKALLGDAGVEIGASGVQGEFAASFYRGVAITVLLISVALGIQCQPSSKSLQKLFVFWAPLLSIVLISYLVSGFDFAILLRCLNFTAVIVFGAVCASIPSFDRAFYLCIYILALTACTVSLTLYALNSPFSYYTDGFGNSFTGLFFQKDLLSSISGIGLIICLLRISRSLRVLDVFALIVLSTCLVAASTLSSSLAFLLVIPALKFPRISLLCAGLFSAILPVIHPLLSEIAIMLGKDPTLTGRTLLWNFTVIFSFDAPFLGHGFRHVSDLAEWRQLLASQFLNDRLFIPHSHNLWVEGFYKFGGLGVAVLFWTLVLAPFLRFRTRASELEGKVSELLLPFLLFKSSLIVPFLGSDTLSYLWAFSLSHLVYRSTKMNHQRK